LVVASSGVARAGGAALSGILELDYRHGFDEAPVENAVMAGVRARALFGERLAACVGLDGRVGIGGGGAVYDAALYPLGLALRYGRTSHLAVCGGVGLEGVSGGAVPPSVTVPLELHWEATGAFRVIRPLVVARVSRRVTHTERDELGIHVLLGLRVMLPLEFVPEISAGDGVYVGLTYDDALGARLFGVAIGYALAANR
jgi:hypothetical protein